MTFTYTPGTGSAATVLARPDLVVLTTAAAMRLEALWQSINSGADAAAMLDALTAGGISSTPNFVLVSGLGTPSSIVMARGTLAVTVRRGAESQVVDGSSVSSWVETRLDGITGLQLGSPAEGDAPRLPLVHGAAPAVAVTWGDQESAAAPASAPQVSAPVEQAPAASASVAPAVVQPPAVTSAAVESAPVVPVAVVPAPAVPTPAVPATVAPPPAPEPAAPPTEATLGAAAMTIAPPPESADDEAPAETAGASGYDHLFGATVMRSVEEAAVRVEDESDAEGEIGDRTVVVADIAALRAQRRAERGRTASAPPAPRFAVELPSGERELLDQSIIVGRAPSATRVSGSAVPRLVTITTPNQDISRSHVQISVEGDTVVVTDLHSMNGTLVTVPGRNPQRLREGEPTTVITGTVLDLGDGATLVVREV